MNMGEKKGVKLDKWGYQVNTSSDNCISAINDYYLQVLSFGRKRSIILDAPLHDHNCVLANILAAHYLHSTNPSKASSFLQSARTHYEEGTAYEKAVFDAVSYLMSEDIDDDFALQLHSKLLKDFPRDLVSLKRAQLLCFYTGQPSLSLHVVEQVLPKMNKKLTSMLGRMDEAESATRKALEINPQDYWAQHCLCHVLQYECRFAEAVKFMKDCSPSWSSCSSFLYTHNWWHVALCYLEGCYPLEKVLDVYDHHIVEELHKPDATHPEVYLNALGLLLRLHVRGEINLYESRLETLASHLTDKAIWYIEWHLDVLILWALARIGKLSAAQELIEGLRSRVSKMNKKKQQLMQRGLSLAQAVYEYGRGNDKRALELFGLDFDANDYKVIGASDEQVDVFNEVFYTVLLNTGQASKAIENLERRLKKRDQVPFLWRLLAKGYHMTGREEAESATEKAMH